MNLRGRLTRLATFPADRGGDDLATLVVWVPAGGDPDDRPPGVYRTSGVLNMVYEGDAPDPALEARVRPRATPTALNIVLGPEVVLPPATDEEPTPGRPS